MSFQAYIDNIFAKTGKTPAEFKKIAKAKGFLEDGKIAVKVTQILDWLKQDFDLGRGHAIAIVATFKGYARDNKKKTEEGVSES